MLLRSHRSSFAIASLLLALLASVGGCGTSSPLGHDAGTDTGLGTPDAPSDAPAPPGDAPGDAPDDAARDAASAADAPASCLSTHASGERFPVGDGCNFCDCAADGSTTCSTRTCVDSIGGCTYDGTAYAYGARFPSTDGCNECVCAASGLACTRRASCPGGLDEGAILMESLDESCGADPTFTARSVLEGLPHDDLTAPFLYDRARASYPESLPDTTVRMRIVYENGFFAVCRLPMPDQPAIDMQVTLEWITADGAFDEGLPAYLRRNDFGFVDAWWVAATVPLGELSGSYTPNCALDPGDYAFDAQLDPDGHAAGSIRRVCETDLSFDVGTFERPAP